MPIAIVLPEPPRDAEDVYQPVKLWMLILSVVLTIISAAIYRAIFLVVQDFKSCSEASVLNSLR